MFCIKEVNSFEELLKLKSEWNNLLDNSETNTIFLRHEWITNWWRFFGHDKELLVLVARQNEKIVGIAPLMLTYSKTFGVKSKKIQFIGAPMSDYSDFIIAEHKEMVLNAIYDYLFQNKRLWDAISLEEIPSNSSSLTASHKILKGSTKNFDVYFTNECMKLDFKVDGEDSIWKLLNKRDITRHIRFFEENGKLDCYKAENQNEMQSLMPAFFEQHIRIWDKKGIPSMFNNENCKQFFLELSRELLQKQKFDLWVLKFNEKVIAMNIGFAHANKYITYCHSYDLEYLKHAPSMVLFKYFIEYYFKQGFDEIDFSRGLESYKFRFSNKKYINKAIGVYKSEIGNAVFKKYNRIKEIIIKNKKLHDTIAKYRKILPHKKIRNIATDQL